MMNFHHKKYDEFGPNLPLSIHVLLKVIPENIHVIDQKVSHKTFHKRSYINLITTITQNKNTTYPISF